MPALAVWYGQNAGHHSRSYRSPMLWALCFAFAGDSFLLFDEQKLLSTSLFIPGLLSFLLTHLCYLILFLRISHWRLDFLRQHSWIGVGLVVLLLGMLGYLWPDLPGGLNFAVAIYSSCIVLMTAMAINTAPQLTRITYSCLVLGALAFLFSDIWIALNKFKSLQLSNYQVRLIIMFFYLLGQGCLAYGVWVVGQMNYASQFTETSKETSV